MMRIKCVSLWQPWATAMALALKGNETRHWSTSHRGPIAIQAAKHWDREQQAFAVKLWKMKLLPDPGELPFGRIVCVTTLVDMQPTERITFAPRDAEVEHMLGNYAPGRWAWVTDKSKLHRLSLPVAYKGQQGLFDIPLDILGLSDEVKHSIGTL